MKSSCAVPAGRARLRLWVPCGVATALGCVPLLACSDDAPLEAQLQPAVATGVAPDGGSSLPPAPDDLDALETRVRFELASSTVPAFDAQPWPGLGAADASGAPLGAPARFPGADAVFTDSMLSDLSSLDGFGHTGPIYFHFDGDLDPASLPPSAAASTAPDASLFVIDVDTNSATPFARVPIRTAYDPEAQRLSVLPARGELFLPGIRYVAVATTRLRDTDGLPIGPSEDLLAVRELAPTGEAGQRYRALLNSLEAVDVAPDTVAGLASFRAQSVASPDLATVLGATDGAEEPPPPFVAAAFQGEALVNVLGPNQPGDLGLSPDDGFDYTGLGALVQLRITVPNLRSSEAGRPGHFERDERGAWTVKRWEPVTMTLLLPRRINSDTPVPLVMYAHGWARERSDTLALARTLCGAGFAVAALDAPAHGTRLGDTDREGRFTGQAEPDGFGDQIADPLSLRTAGLEGAAVAPLDFRDLPRQWALDMRVALRALRTLPPDLIVAALDGEYGDLRFDLEGVGLIGESLGAVAAMMVAESEPSVGALVLVGVGDGVEDWLTMPGFRDARAALGRRLALPPTLTAGAVWAQEAAFAPAFGLFATMLGGASPAAWASKVRRSPAHMLLLRPELDDRVSALASDAMARIIGVEADAAEREVEAAPLGDPEAARQQRRFPAATRGALVERVGILRYRIEGSRVERLPSPERIKNPVASLQGAALEFLQSWNDCRARPGTGCRVGL